METKSFPVKNIKALGEGDPDGTFEAIVAVFGNVDSYGDRVVAGAFKDSLVKGFPAIVWSHQWREVPIGACLEAEETTEGLRIKGQLFIEENDRAREVYAAMKNVGGDGLPPLREFSFSYDIIDADWTVEDEEHIFELQKLDAIEVGPCLKGVNDETRLIGVKAQEKVVEERKERFPKPKAEDPEETDDAPKPDAAEARAKAVDLMTAPPPPLA
ncbi:MAG TPA: HK97 family phage prohead protease [Solirubrobacterales bacterium]|nr:HK97 family phage prohead protease [Solirubrobacterales bacterium]